MIAKVDVHTFLHSFTPKLNLLRRWSLLWRLVSRLAAEIEMLYDAIFHENEELYTLSGPSLPVPVELVSGDVFIVAPEYVDAPEC